MPRSPLTLTALLVGLLLAAPAAHAQTCPDPATPAFTLEDDEGALLLLVCDDGTLQVPAGAANGYVLTTDADGNASWQPAPSGGSLALPFAGSVAEPGAALSIANTGAGAGLAIPSAGADGVLVTQAGSPTDAGGGSSQANGFEVQSAQGHGLYVGYSDLAGIRIERTRGNGIVSSIAGTPSRAFGPPATSAFATNGTEGYGLYVGQADADGVFVRSATGQGVNVFEARTGVFASNVQRGMDVVTADLAGYQVRSVGTPSATSIPSHRTGVAVHGSEGYGLFVGRADRDAVVVRSSDESGLRVDAANTGVAIGNAAQHGFYVQDAAASGLWINNAGGRAIQISEAAAEGINIDHAGGTGLRVRDADEFGAQLVNTSTLPTLALTQNGTGALLSAGTPGDTRFAVTNTGNVLADGTFQGGGADLAEAFAVEGDRAAYAPGDVLAISTRTDRTVERSDAAYSTRVLGVYATKPGVLLAEDGLGATVPMGVVGVLPTKVSGENGPIRRGDLLVTAAAPGHAMKAGPNPPAGSVLGKALENFDAAGTGRIQVFVNVR